ncbi:kinase-like domain-containing protein [Trichoderma velutinum]
MSFSCFESRHPTLSAYLVPISSGCRLRQPLQVHTRKLQPSTPKKIIFSSILTFSIISFGFDVTMETVRSILDETLASLSTESRIHNREHIEVSKPELIPYRHIDNLGLGASAIVDRVEHTATAKVYARKQYRIKLSQDSDYVKWQFLNEVQIMKRVSGHHHMIRYVASYICGRELSFIFEPVADSGSLATLLQNIRDSGEPNLEEQRILLHSLGCLASGLAFIHEKTIRHKDIKPENILVHRGKVMYADFGVSFDGSGLGSSTTTGIPDGFSRRYCAPEVVARSPGPRNERTDIFSLGCVYAEILATLEPDALPLSLLRSCYAENIEKIARVLPKMQFSNLVDRVKRVCIQMLARTNGARPAAQDLTKYFSDELSPTYAVGFTLRSRFVCEHCAPPIIEIQTSKCGSGGSRQDHPTKSLFKLRTGIEAESRFLAPEEELNMLKYLQWQEATQTQLRDFRRARNVIAYSLALDFSSFRLSTLR